ncbi:MAG TPA: IPT/TIG domain-containing protein [Polyangia bacterium]|nr:IPT/TIG domain-containing protein [Polyangia bacterium]
MPLQGNLHVEASDGFAVIGETLWIHGTAFGRQPAVTVGGRPAAVLARTRDGGILVRVPPLTPMGAQPVVVSNDVGRGEKPVTVRRLAAVLSGDAGQLAWAELGPDGVKSAGVTPVPGRRLLAMSPDGRAAYVAEAGRSAVDVIDVAANGAPKVVYQLDLGKEPVLGLAAAARAWTVAVVRASDVVLLDVTSALRPARSTPRVFPAEVRDARIVSADLSPDGKTLALASEEGNHVTLLDLTARGHATVAATLPVLPDVRESVIADVAFSPAGDTLWIATGDTTRSRAAGPQPTQVFAARVETGPPVTMTVARALTLPDAEAPDRLSTGRTIPLPSGAAIRLPPERTPVFLTAKSRAGDAATPKGGAVFRVGAEDAATAMLFQPGRFGQPDLSPDGRWLLTGLIAADGSVRLFAARADGRPGEPRSIPLLGPSAKPAGRGHQLPSVRVQP